jgi:AcrR family transcriptional regulator
MLLESAADVIVETGPSSGVAAVARRAGVSKGALQHHFDTKTDLLIAVVSTGWDDLVGRFDRVADVSRPPEERLRALVCAMWDSYQQPTCRAAFMISSDPNLDPNLADHLAPIFDVARVRLDETWRQIFADLDVPGERLGDARRFVRSHLLGMLVQRQLPSEEPEPERELARLCIAAFEILTAPES